MQDFDKWCVFTQLSSNSKNFCLKSRVGHDKILFHERYNNPFVLSLSVRLLYSHHLLLLYNTLHSLAFPITPAMYNIHVHHLSLLIYYLT
jgi:hypothetical protein